jgi:drug/metabolite transporter (DMT)-like permease
MAFRRDGGKIMKKGILVLILTAFLYASLVIPTRYLTDVNSFFLIWTAFSFVSIVSYVLLKKESGFSIYNCFKRNQKMFLYLGFAHVISSICLNLSVKMIDLSLAGLLLYTAPIWVFSYSILKKEITLNTKNVIVLLVGLLSVLLIISPWDVEDMELNSLGIILGLAAGILYSFDFVLGEKLRKKHSEVEILFMTHFTGAIVLIPNILYWPSSVSMLDLNLIVIYDVIFLLSFLTFMYAMYYVKAFYASIITMLEPLLFGVIGYFLFAETPSIFIVVGGVLIFLNIIYINTFDLNWKQKLLLKWNQIVNRIQ